MVSSSRNAVFHLPRHSQMSPASAPATTGAARDLLGPRAPDTGEVVAAKDLAPVGVDDRLPRRPWLLLHPDGRALQTQTRGEGDVVLRRSLDQLLNSERG